MGKVSAGDKWEGKTHLFYQQSHKLTPSSQRSPGLPPADEPPTLRITERLWKCGRRGWRKTTTCFQTRPTPMKEAVHFHIETKLQGKKEEPDEFIHTVCSPLSQIAGHFLIPAWTMDLDSVMELKYDPSLRKEWRLAGIFAGVLPEWISLSFPLADCHSILVWQQRSSISNNPKPAFVVVLFTVPAPNHVRMTDWLKTAQFLWDYFNP